MGEASNRRQLAKVSRKAKQEKSYLQGTVASEKRSVRKRGENDAYQPLASTTTVMVSTSKASQVPRANEQRNSSVGQRGRQSNHPRQQAHHGGPDHRRSRNRRSRPDDSTEEGHSDDDQNSNDDLVVDVAVGPGLELRDMMRSTGVPPPPQPSASWRHSQLDKSHLSSLSASHSMFSNSELALRHQLQHAQRARQQQQHDQQKQQQQQQELHHQQQRRRQKALRDSQRQLGNDNPTPVAAVLRDPGSRGRLDSSDEGVVQIRDQAYLAAMAVAEQQVNGVKQEALEQIGDIQRSLDVLQASYNNTHEKLLVCSAHAFGDGHVLLFPLLTMTTLFA